MKEVISMKLLYEEVEEMRKMHRRRDTAYNCMCSSQGKEKTKYRREFELCESWIEKKLQLYAILYGPEEYLKIDSPKVPWVNYIDNSLNFSTIPFKH